MTRRSDTITVLVDTTDVRGTEFSLPPGRKGDSHYHSVVIEYCHCLEGSAAISLRGSRRRIPASGEKPQIEAGITYQVINVATAVFRYLVILGVGAFDLVRGTITANRDEQDWPVHSSGGR